MAARSAAFISHYSVDSRRNIVLSTEMMSQMWNRLPVSGNRNQDCLMPSAAKRLFSLFQKNRFPRVQIFPLDHNRWNRLLTGEFYKPFGQLSDTSALRCCMRDERWLLGVSLQHRAQKHLRLLFKCKEMFIGMPKPGNGYKNCNDTLFLSRFLCSKHRKMAEVYSVHSS
jgi:hypothetical protein